MWGSEKFACVNRRDVHGGLYYGYGSAALRPHGIKNRGLKPALPVQVLYIAG
jgi:hypothetical protein